MKRVFVMTIAVSAVAVTAVAAVFFYFNQPSGSKSFELDAQEFGFNQVDGGPTLKVKVGDIVTITLVNMGVEEHEWMVVSKDTLAVALNPAVGEKGEEELERILGGHPEPVFEGASIHHIEPDETETITFVVDTAGEYIYGCFIDEPDGVLHAFRGMWGEFVVEP